MREPKRNIAERLPASQGFTNVQTRIADVLHITGQDPPKSRRFSRTWVGSRHANCTVSEDGFSYFCHSTGTGGDAVRLYMEITGATLREALAALEAAGIRTPARRMSAAEIAEQRRRRAATDRHRLAVADFARALNGELDRLKLEAVEAEGVEALERASDSQYKLSLAPATFMAEMMRTDAPRALALIALGRADRENAAAITRIVVELLAQAEGVRDVA